MRCAEGTVIVASVIETCARAQQGLYFALCFWGCLVSYAASANLFYG